MLLWTTTTITGSPVKYTSAHVASSPLHRLHPTAVSNRAFLLVVVKGQETVNQRHWGRRRGRALAGDAEHRVSRAADALGEPEPCSQAAG